MSRFRSESWCSTIVREMSLICIRIRNSFPFEWLCTRTRFETEACSNSEMGYSGRILCCVRFHGEALLIYVLCFFVEAKEFLFYFERSISCDLRHAT